jgi:hypothetical protein
VPAVCISKVVVTFRVTSLGLFQQSPKG